MRKIFFGVICSLLLIACNNKPANDSGNEPTSVSSAGNKPATEVLDLKEADVVKASFAALSKGDVDAMMTNYADDATHYWSAGDSAAGKTAIADYWKGRWKLIDSLTFSESIVLPIRINESQSPEYAPTGKWVLAWTFSHVKYKNGKKLDFWAHTDYYFNDAGKIATVIQYIDRAPIMEATKGLVAK
jgi:ketosteroid isomerase-like protein